MAFASSLRGTSVAHQVLQQLEAKVLHLQRPPLRHQPARDRHHRVRLGGLQLHEQHRHAGCNCSVGLG